MNPSDDDDRFAYLFNRKTLLQRRRELRNHSTAAEAVLWRHLQKRLLLGKKFRRQHSIGPFIVDFYCPECRVIVELDGAVHKGILAAERDGHRSALLEGSGKKILRFENRLVFKNLDGVLETIRQTLQERQ
jgi:very-short-patch-repair endonuclease